MLVRIKQGIHENYRYPHWPWYLGSYYGTEMYYPIIAKFVVINK